MCSGTPIRHWRSASCCCSRSCSWWTRRFKIVTALSILFWPVILLIDLMAVALALFTASLASILVVFALTAIATALWIFRLPPELPEAPGMLLVIGTFAVFFLAAAIFAARKVLAGLGPAPGGV